MSSASTPFDRYQAAFSAYCDFCADAPELWHRPDIAEFTELRRLLLPPAESGDLYCQSALATILFMGLCCASEEEFLAGHTAAREEATRWWMAAAKQGFWPALDNLVVCGVGPEAQQARDASRLLQQERRDLVGSSHGMPVHWPEFFQELSRRLYGRFITDSAER